MVLQVTGNQTWSRRYGASICHGFLQTTPLMACAVYSHIAGAPDRMMNVADDDRPKSDDIRSIVTRWSTLIGILCQKFY
jgi:hypothetical protein